MHVYKKIKFVVKKHSILSILVAVQLIFLSAKLDGGLMKIKTIKRAQQTFNRRKEEYLKAYKTKNI